MVDRIVFVHGWSIHDTETYGALPARLAQGVPGTTVAHLHLARYVSFRDEVRMSDVARALEAAVQKELNPAGGAKFAAITHSTGGPVVRTWWHQYYLRRKRPCPMSHVIHLAAAHFGSALAQLGKSTLGRIKSFTESIEPGEGILDWLELGSAESLALNAEWAATAPVPAGPDPVFQFCLTGQQIDRQFYDQLNSYTGEMGSDGTVRVPAANLNFTHVRLRQRVPTGAQLEKKRPSILEFDSPGLVRSQEVPFTLVPGVSHVGERKGIMRSVKKSGAAPAVVERIKEALAVKDPADYARVAAQFQEANAAVHEAEAVERETRIFQDRFFLHDPCSMVIVRVRDEEGAVPKNLRITFLGPQDNPNGLPEGFLIDRQQNKKNPGTMTFFFNCAIMSGAPARHAVLPDGRRKKIRGSLPGLAAFGLLVEADPETGFAHYHPAMARATPALLGTIIRADETTILDITLRRIVRANTFSLTGNLTPTDFRRIPPGGALPA